MRRLIALWLASCAPLLADGGTLLFHDSAGSFDVTVFCQADAVHVGMNDISVLVQKNGSAVMNATVLLHLGKSTGLDITRITSIATHAKATNKTMYAASMNAPSEGTWRLAVDVKAGADSGLAAENIQVRPPLPPMENYWPYIAMVPFALIAFAINRWLRKKMGVRRR